MIFGKHDENTLVQFRDVASRAMGAALMADGHLGYIMPVGGVTAYRNQVSIAGVGYDIGCGNTAIKTDLQLDDLVNCTRAEIEANPARVLQNRRVNRLADEIFSQLSFGIGRKNLADDAPVDHELFVDPAWWAIPNAGGYRDSLMHKGRNQLGTIGSGNHYVDIFVDESEHVWVGVHFGSRGFGHTIASNFLALDSGKMWGERAKEHEGLLDLDSPIGQDYWALKSLASKYAFVGREWVCRKVVELLGGTPLEIVANHHNDAWKEEHVLSDVEAEPETFVVVRKGATPAFPGQKGFVGGSMGDNAVILQGALLGDGPNASAIAELQRQALYSTVHGAGRVMSRTKAAGKWRKGRQVERGAISRQEMESWIADKGVVLRGAGLDEAPQAYRRLPKVLQAQGPTVTVLHDLKPIIVCMAPANEIDPFRD
jgi:tRNA-splicing ligase RtcB (3'-phosphate/5'-hydroxy nucleic acid ligase)